MLPYLKVLIISVLIGYSASISAQTRDIPDIAVDDPSAIFQSDQGRITFDPICRTPDLEYNLSIERCRTALEAHKTSASIQATIPALKKAEDDEGRKAALSYLNAAIAVEDHAAAHYLKASLYFTGEVLKPDFSIAFQHASYAANNGNPAAMDILATLYMHGKGTEQSIALAEHWYAKAAKNGYSKAALNLALLNLNGRYKKPDLDFGRAVLLKAQKAGIPQADAGLNMVSMNIKNYQLEPTPDGKNVQLVAYGALDNTEIPPTAGFTKDFRELHYSAFSNTETLVKLKEQESELAAPYLYELGRRISLENPQKAIGLFFLAAMRMTYQADKCLDTSAAQSLGPWFLKYIGENRWLTKNTDLTIAKKYADVEFAKNPGNGDPWWLCYGGMRSMSEAAGENITSSPYKPEFDSEAAMEKASKLTSMFIASLTGPRK